MVVIEKVEKEMEKLKENRMFFEVENTEWCSPLVIIPKKNSAQVRVCMDYKPLNSLFSPQPTDPDNQETLFVDDAASSTSLHSFRPDLGFPRASPTDVYCRENATRSHRIAHQPRERRAALPIPNPHRGEGLGSVLSRPLPSGIEHGLTWIREPLRMQALKLHSSSR